MQTTHLKMFGELQKRYLVIATGTPAQPGKLVQIQTQP
jgi:hypothetical protein